MVELTSRMRLNRSAKDGSRMAFTTLIAPSKDFWSDNWVESSSAFASLSPTSTIVNEPVVKLPFWARGLWTCALNRKNDSTNKALLFTPNWSSSVGIMWTCFGSKVALRLKQWRGQPPDSNSSKESSSYQIVMLHLYKRLRWDEGDSDPPLPPSSANFPPHLHHHNLPLLLQPLLCVPEANNSWPVIYLVFPRQEYNDWMLNIISCYGDCTWHHFGTPSFEGLQVVQGLHSSFILFKEKHSTFWRWNKLRKHTCVSCRIPLR